MIQKLPIIIGDHYLSAHGQAPFTGNFEASPSAVDESCKSLV